MHSLDLEDDISGLFGSAANSKDQPEAAVMLAICQYLALTETTFRGNAFQFLR